MILKLIFSCKQWIVFNIAQILIEAIFSIYFVWLTFRRSMRWKSEILISRILNERYCVVRSEQMFLISFRWLIDQIVSWRNVVERLFDVSFCYVFEISFRNCCWIDKNHVFESLIWIRKRRNRCDFSFRRLFFYFFSLLLNNRWKFFVFFFYV